MWAPEPVVGLGYAEVARVAAAQRGFVQRGQLLRAGWSRHVIAHRLRTKALIAYWTGVYLVGRPTVEPLGPETAAVLFFDGDGVLSDATAVGLWDLRALPDTVHVTVVGRCGRTRTGLCVHRRSTLAAGDVVAHRGLPVTSSTRTVIDLAGAVSAWELEQTVAEARVKGLIRPGELEAAVERSVHLPGVPAIRALLRAETDPAFTRRALERRMLSLIRQAQLPPPRVNANVKGFEVDFFWPEQKLIVETDGGQFHNHPRAFENDRRRDQILLAAGYRVMRITWRQLRDEPLAVVARLTAALHAQAA